MRWLCFTFIVGWTSGNITVLSGFLRVGGIAPEGDGAVGVPAMVVVPNRSVAMGVGRVGRPDLTAPTALRGVGRTDVGRAIRRSAANVV